MSDTPRPNEKSFSEKMSFTRCPTISGNMSIKRGRRPKYGMPGFAACSKNEKPNTAIYPAIIMRFIDYCHDDMAHG
jgi:hypothetical protein